MRYDKNILGFNGFIWFNGVVEDRNDPQNLAECECVVSVFIRKTRQYYPRRIYLGRRLYCDYISGISGFGQSPAFFSRGHLGVWIF